MRILIIGNNPHEIGGVANYTRPLAKNLQNLDMMFLLLFGRVGWKIQLAYKAIFED